MEKQSNLAQFYFDRADVFMIAISNDEVVADVNKRASDTLGCLPEEIKGKNWFESFVPEDSREEARRLFHNMLIGSLRHVHFEQSIMSKRGKELTLNFHNVLISDGKGNTIGMLSSAEDVTERRRKQIASKELENRLQISLDYMIEGCQIIDYDWRYVYVNEAVAKQGRKKKEELLGYTMMQVYPGIDRTEMFSHLRNCMVNRLAYQLENKFVFSNGLSAWFELRIAPVPEGLLILSIDITKNKEVEAELSKYRYRLEQVVAQRTAECAKTNEELTRKIQELQKTRDALRLRTMILDKTKEAIFLVNTKGDFLYANDGATTAYGYGLDEFLNMNLRMLLQLNDSSSLDMLLKHITESGGATLEMIHMHKDGTQMPVKLYSNLVETMHGKSIVLVVRRLNYR